MIGGLAIAFIQLAPGEKSEHLIYAILPLSMALYFVVQWEVTALTLTLASLAASFLALILFELSIDEISVKAIFRRFSGEKYGFQKRRFVLWNMFLRPWEDELSSFDSTHDEDRLEREISQMSQAAVSSSLINSRLWRLRAELYFMAAVLFLVPTATSVVKKLAGTENVLSQSWLDIIKYLDGVLDQIEWWLALLLIAVIGVVAYYRYRHLSNDIRYLAQFRYLQRNLAIKKMKRKLGEHHEEEGDRVSEEEAVLVEIELQNEILLSRDWSVFTDHCSRWSRELSGSITKEIEENGMYILMSPWAVLASHEISKEESEKQWRKLQWVHYYFKKLEEYRTSYIAHKKRCEFWKSIDDDAYPKLDENSLKSIDHIGELIEEGIDKFKEPNVLLETLVMFQPDSKSTSAVLWSIAGGSGLGYSLALEKGVLKLLTAFNTINGTGLDREKAAKAIIHVFNDHIPEKLSIWGEGDVPYHRLTNIIKTVGCDTDGLARVGQHCIENSPGTTLQKIKEDNELYECVIKLGLEESLKERGF